jgi:hypothetical protein
LTRLLYHSIQDMRYPCCWRRASGSTGRASVADGTTIDQRNA